MEFGQILRLDNPWSAGTDLLALDVTTAEHAQCRHRADADDFCRLFQLDLAAFSPFSVAVGGNLVVLAEAVHALLGPSNAHCHQLVQSIEETCNLPVRHKAGQVSNKRDQVAGDRRVVPVGSIEFQFELQGREVAALPMQNHFYEVIVSSHNDFVEAGAQNPFARRRRSCWMRPSA